MRHPPTRPREPTGWPAGRLPDTPIIRGTADRTQARESIAGIDGECVPGVRAWMVRAVEPAGVPVEYAMWLIDVPCVQQGAGSQGLPAGVLDHIGGMTSEGVIGHLDRLEAAGLVRCEDNGDGTRDVIVLVRLV